MVVIRPFGVLLIMGRLEGDGRNEEGSRVCEIGEFVKSWNMTYEYDRRVMVDNGYYTEYSLYCTMYSI